MELTRERFRGRRNANKGLVCMASIAFILTGVLDELPESDPQFSRLLSEGNQTVQGRRYCDPPNMTALAAYYESSEEANYDYDFLQNQGAAIESNISTSDIRTLRKNIIRDWGNTFSYFPAYYLTSKFGPSKVFARSTLTLCCLAYVLFEVNHILQSFVLGLLDGVTFFSFCEMVFHFMTDNREILISSAAVKYVGVSISELITAYHINGVQQRYKYYVILFIIVIWFYFWSSAKSTGFAGRRTKNTRMPTPWLDILCSRPVGMTMLALFAAACGKACISSVTRMYLKNIYCLPVEELSAISEFLHFAFSIACGVSVYHLIKGRIVSVTSSRRMAVYVSHFIPAGVLFVLGFVGCGEITPKILYCLAMVFTGANYSGVLSSPLDLAPTHPGSVMALCFTIGSLGLLFMDYLTYYILTNQAFMSWRFIFSLNSLLLLVSAIFFMLRGSGSAQPWNDPGHRVIKEKNKNVSEAQVSVAEPAPKPRTKSIYMVEKKILKVLHVQEPDKFTRVRAYSTSLPNERGTLNRPPNIYRPSNKKRASIS